MLVHPSPLPRDPPAHDGGPGRPAARAPAGDGDGDGAPSFPAGLHVVARPPAGGWKGYRGPVVVLVHGSLDRAASFARTERRLPAEWALIAYDRRGYDRSQAAGVVDLAGHVDDCHAVVGAVAGAGRRVTAVGHSMGGVVVLGAAVAWPEAFASVAAFEPPMPWLGFTRRGTPRAVDPPPADPSEEAERFFRRMVSDAAWARLPAAAKAARRADGPALVAELAALRRGVPAPFEVTDLAVPALFGCGGPATEDRRRRTAAWLAEHVGGGHLLEIPEAGHGAHLSHPSAFADFVRAAVALGHPAGAAPDRRRGPRR